MKTMRSALALTVLVVGLGGVVWAQGMKGHEGMDHMQPADSDAASTKDFKAAHAKMMEDMAVAYTGNTDVDFVRGMIPHHQGAIDMAKVELKYGKDPEIRKLAEAIIAAQEKEIGQMRAWLKKNKK
jgi:uncharacterized protein (DUF305 family)